jgi:hypothetical protein
VDSDIEKRSGPQLRDVMRAENGSGSASIEMLKTAWQTASRQYEKRSRARTASVDQISTCVFAEEEVNFTRSISAAVALSTD